MADIFLSYARPDQATAKRLAQRLERLGWSVWWDTEILSGDAFERQIQNQLDDAHCIVVLWSTASVKSPFVRDEANEGLRNGRLVPVLIEPVTPPLGFRQTQYSNLTAQPSRQSRLEFSRLVESITTKVAPSLRKGRDPIDVKTPSDLKNVLDSLTLRTRQGTANGARQMIADLEMNFAVRWHNVGTVAESFGRAWAAVGDLDKAEKYYTSATTASDGGATLASFEQLANVQVRLAWSSVSTLRNNLSKGRTSLGKRLADARASIQGALALLERVQSLRQAVNVEILMANAYKRLALIETIAGNSRREALALAATEKHFARAQAMLLKDPDVNGYYVTLGKMSAHLAQHAGRARHRRLDPSDVKRLRDDIAVVSETDPDFWTVLASIELELFQAVDHGAMAQSHEQLAESYRALRSRLNIQSMWIAAYDSAHFVLSRYARRASTNEGRGAAALLAELKGAANLPS